MNFTHPFSPILIPNTSYEKKNNSLGSQGILKICKTSTKPKNYFKLGLLKKNLSNEKITKVQITESEDMGDVFRPHKHMDPQRSITR